MRERMVMRTDALNKVFGFVSAKFALKLFLSAGVLQSVISQTQFCVMLCA